VISVFKTVSLVICCEVMFTSLFVWFLYDLGFCTFVLWPRLYCHCLCWGPAPVRVCGLCLLVVHLCHGRLALLSQYISASFVSWVLS